MAITCRCLCLIHQDSNELVDLCSVCVCVLYQFSSSDQFQLWNINWDSLRSRGQFHPAMSQNDPEKVRGLYHLFPRFLTDYAHSERENLRLSLYHLHYIYHSCLFLEECQVVWRNSCDLSSVLCIMWFCLADQGRWTPFDWLVEAYDFSYGFMWCVSVSE